MTKLHSMGLRESVCGPRGYSAHILQSLSCFLSQEMFVHNLGARNGIHLFVLWRGVLQNIDERQSVGEMCVQVRVSKSRRIERKLWMNEVDRVAARIERKEA